VGRRHRRWQDGKAWRGNCTEAGRTGQPSPCHRSAVLVYKILLPTEWAEFETTGRFNGSPFDRSSNFIHCSSRQQVGSTALRVFAQEPALVVVALDTQVLGESVRWEEAPDGGLFPHVYATLVLSAVVAVHRIAGASSVDEVLPPVTYG
jgi:uncharacterized protein (DUF952 family)